MASYQCLSGGKFATFRRTLLRFAWRSTAEADMPSRKPQRRRPRKKKHQTSARVKVESIMKPSVPATSLIFVRRTDISPSSAKRRSRCRIFFPDVRDAEGRHELGADVFEGFHEFVDFVGHLRGVGVELMRAVDGHELGEVAADRLGLGKGEAVVRREDGNLAPLRRRLELRPLVVAHLLVFPGEAPEDQKDLDRLAQRRQVEVF
mmetsp:Transcript_21181/g.68330  ORF Transcript_21181/g.68330 Transcript_21181/m.68330 type:complete len:205 (+) Transcript_21181:1668-2282(+)